MDFMIWSFVAPIHIKSLPKPKLGNVGIILSIAYNHSPGPNKAISEIILHQFAWKVDQK